MERLEKLRLKAYSEVRRILAHASEDVEDVIDRAISDALDNQHYDCYRCFKTAQELEAWAEEWYRNTYGGAVPK